MLINHWVVNYIGFINPPDTIDYNLFNLVFADLEKALQVEYYRGKSNHNNPLNCGLMFFLGLTSAAALFKCIMFTYIVCTNFHCVVHKADNLSLIKQPLLTHVCVSRKTQTDGACVFKTVVEFCFFSSL